MWRLRLYTESLRRFVQKLAILHRGNFNNEAASQPLYWAVIIARSFLALRTSHSIVCNIRANS
ncbi:Uncharacterized protein APZ42_027958 [Daphnia magna]|uniref:Uncharacterized protein n=1 Tax=Daphnia magna TaxID=35525 RepID=A0A162D817_9CRUS|nr:Uncharacterized protein APZ42_027958 [Daphnia magna]